MYIVIIDHSCKNRANNETGSRELPFSGASPVWRRRRGKSLFTKRVHGRSEVPHCPHPTLTSVSAVSLSTTSHTGLLKAEGAGAAGICASRVP